MSTRSLITVAALMSGAVLTQGHGFSQSEWSYIASACTLDEASTGKYNLDFARLQFAGTATGEVAARCNVINPLDINGGGNPGWNRLDVTYQDPDGQAAASRVSVQLRRVDRITGLSYTVATFDSNSYPSGQQLKTLSFSHTFNFLNYGYYVGISLTRSSSSAAVRAQRVRLYVAPPG